MVRSRRLLSVEQLEDRLTPSSSIWGVPWPNAGQLTLSFAPDGTQAGLSSSNLFQTLNQVAPTPTWQLEIVRAFQTWAANANINIGVVPDGGQALGSPGAVQGDSRFGDIRIAATAPRQGSTVDLANSQPFSWTGTTWSGDVVLNSSYPFSVGNPAGQYDLYSVMLHEAGHVLGFDGNQDPSSALYGSYEYHTQLSASDIAGLQTLYGPRLADTQGNNSIATAQPLNTSLQGGSTAGTIESVQEADYYRIQTPGFLSGINGFNVQVKTSGISLLMPSLSVYDAAGHQLGSASAVDALHGDLSFSVNARPSSTYYIRVGNDTSSVFGVGSYQLNVTNHYGFLSLGNIVNGLNTVLDGTLSTAQHLLSRNSGNDLVPDYFVQGNLSAGVSGDYYVVQSPSSPSGSPANMVAMVWALDVNGLSGRIHVFDAAQNPVPVEVIANDGGTYTIQLAGVTPNAPYYIEVAAANPGAAQSSGRYALVVDFHQQQLVSFDNITAGTLSQAQAQTAGTLTTTREELFHFALSSFAANANAWVVMTIVDENGTVIATLQAQAGQPTVTANIYLRRGAYSVLLSAYTTDGSSLDGIGFNLDGDPLSGPVGAYPASPGTTGNTPPSSTSSPQQPAPPSSYTPGPGSPTASTPPSGKSHYY